MRKRLIIKKLLTSFIIAALCFCIPVVSVSAESGTAVKIKVGNKSFNGIFYNNDTADALLKSMPMKLKMSELNGNEKYRYLKKDYPTDAKKVNRVKAGDIMLYTSDQMVIFYGSNSWAYTRLGKITDKSAKELADLLGGYGVKVTVSAD
jgi:hypothetical protein